MNRNYLQLILPLILVLVTSDVFGQGKDDQIRPVTKTVALTNVLIVQSPEATPFLGGIIIEDGLISEVGKSISIPINAKVLEGDSLYVYAGFIDGLSHIGVPKPKSNANGRRGTSSKPNDTGNPSNERAGIQPDRQLKEVLKTDESSIAGMRKLGFTMSHVVPRGRMLPGQGALVVLKGKTPMDMIYQENTALFAQLKSASGVYPGTVIGVMSKFRELYKQAEQMYTYESQYKTDPNGMKRPTISPAHRALYKATTGDQPIFFFADDVKSMYRIMALKKDLGFPLVLGGIKQSWHLVDQLKENEIPIFLSLDLPKAPKNAKSKKGKKKDSPSAKIAMTAKGGEKEGEDEKLEARRAKELKKHYKQAGMLAEAGLNFGFSSMEAKSSEIRKNLRVMIENGLNESTALAALTTHPANLLGISKVAGTVEVGKLGNLVVTDKPYFEEKSNVRYVLVEGEIFEYEVKKKSPSNAKVDPAGNWSY